LREYLFQVLDPLPHEKRRNPPTRRFDFGQLGHRLAAFLSAPGARRERFGFSAGVRFGSVQLMEPHRPRPQQSDIEGRPSRRGGRDTLPLDSDWLEREAMRYVAQWEATRQGVREVLERRLQARCERTGEDPGTLIDAIPRVLDLLVDRGYVDDRRFAKQRIERSRRQGRSTARIRAELEAKGADPSLLAELEAEIATAGGTGSTGEVAAAPESPGDPELEAAWRTARKRRLGPYCVDPAQRTERRQRHLAVLARQGFSREISYRVVDAHTPLQTDPFETDQ
jgi:regulatory protein